MKPVLLNFCVAMMVFVFAPNGLAAASQCEVALDKMIKGSGLGDSRAKIGSRVTATSFTKAAITGDAPKQVVETHLTVLAEAKRLSDSSNRASERLSKLQEQVDAVIAEFDALIAMKQSSTGVKTGEAKNFDVVPTMRALSNRRRQLTAKWRTALDEFNRAGSRQTAFFNKQEVGWDFVDGKVTLVKKSKDDAAKNVLEARRQEAAALLKIFAPRIGTSLPPFDFDEIELIRDETKHANYWSNKQKIDDAHLATLPQSWSAKEVSAIEGLLSIQPVVRKVEIQTALANAKSEMERGKPTDGNSSFEIWNRLQWETRVRPLIIFKKGGKVIGALHNDQEDAPTRVPQRGFRCDGGNISGGWAASQGFVPIIRNRLDCRSKYDSDVCTFAFDFESFGLEIPDPDKSNVYQQKPSEAPKPIAR